jgi:hypothetical protein
LKSGIVSLACNPSYLAGSSFQSSPGKNFMRPHPHLNQWLGAVACTHYPSSVGKHKQEGHGPSQPGQTARPSLKNNQQKGLVGYMGYMVQHLPSKCEVLSSTPVWPKRNKQTKKAGHWLLTPVILATWEAEIGRIAIQGRPGQIVGETLSPK